jgi:hypothetical protein
MSNHITIYVVLAPETVECLSPANMSFSQTGISLSIEDCSITGCMEKACVRLLQWPWHRKQISTAVGFAVKVGESWWFAAPAIPSTDHRT